MRKFLLLFSVLATLISVSALAQSGTPRLDNLKDETFQPGDLILLKGSGFGAALGQVSFNGKFVPANTWGETEVAINAPETLGTYQVSICPPPAGSPCSNPIVVVVTVVSPPDPKVADHENGIVVSDVSPYRDATLQALLNASLQKLASLQLVDQAGIAAHIGALQGANYNVSGLGLSVAGPSLPGVQTTANSGNTATTTLAGTNLQQNSGQTVSTTTGNATVTTGSSPGVSVSSGSELQVTGPSTVNTTNGSAQNVVTGPSTQTVTTQSAQTPLTATIPTTTSYTLPSSFSGSASDILNEQLQTSANIDGYVLLLDGSLNGRFMTYLQNGERKQGIRTRVTLGVPVDIKDSGNYPDAVAEVVLMVDAASRSGLPERPIINAVLPEQKTYNVASIVDHSVSIGGGITTGIASVGATWLWGHKTYYIVKDQDTVAFQLPPTTDQPLRQSLGWQFRPVLGSHRVAEGWRQVYAQLSFPTIDLPEFAGILGEVYVTTRWRPIDKKTGAIGKPIKGSESQYKTPFRIERYDLKPPYGTVTSSDNGDASLTVLVSGSFLSGTTVQVGAKTLSETNSTILRTSESLQFSLASIDAATQLVRIVDSSGAYNNLLPGGARAGKKCFTLDQANASPISSSSMLVKLHVKVENENTCGGGGNGPSIRPLDDNDLVAVVGNRVFGLRDAPFTARAADGLSIVVPSDLLRGSPQVTLQRLFGGKSFSSTLPVAVGGAAAVVSQAVSLGVTADGTRIALIGTGLDGLSPVYPKDAKVEQHNGTGVIVTVPTNELTGLKQIALKDQSDTLVLVTTPTSDDAGPSLDTATPIQVGSAGVVRLTGKGLTSLQSVTYKGKAVKILSKTKEAVTLQLPPEALAKAGSPQLEFVFSKDSKVQYPLNVFSQKVQVDQSTPAAQK